MGARTLATALALAAAVIAIALLVDRGTERPDPLLAPARDGAAPEPSADLRADSAPAPSRSPVLPSAAGGDPTPVTIRALHGGRPVPATGVWSQVDDELEWLGRTGADGGLAVHAGLGCDYVVARHEDYAIAKRRAGRLAGGTELVIELPAGARMVGTVWESGHTRPAGPGVRVCALRGEPQLLGTGDPRDALLAIRDSPVSNVAWTREDGTFEVTNLDPGAEYLLLAGKPGWYVVDVPGPVGPTEVPFDLELAPLYGLQVELVTPPDLSFGLPTASRWHPLGRGPYVNRSLWPDITVLPDRTASHCGTPPAGAPDRNPFFECFRLTVVPSEGPPERMGPFPYDLDLPGFEPVHRDLWAVRLDLPHPPERIELVPTASGFGALSIQAVSAPLQLQLADADEVLGDLRMVGPDGGELSLPVTFGDLRHNVRYAGLPAGRYEARLHDPLERFTLPEDGRPPLVVTIGPAPSTVALDLSPLGALIIEQLDPEGQVDLGVCGFWLYPIVVDEAGARVRGKVRGNRSSKWRTGGEFPVALVPPGEYELVPVGRRVSLVPSVDADEHGSLLEPIPVSIQAGESTRVVIQRLGS